VRVATVLLVRHGRTAANSGGVLAGRSEGVLLDDLGRTQAEETARRIAVLPVAALVSSPLERCQQTAAAISAAAKTTLDVDTDERLTECGYGDWTGQQLKTLARQPMWKVVQAHPSGATFPGGESMRQMQNRAVEAVRDWDARVASGQGDSAVWVAVSHGDVIKAVLADALGMHLDNFQRIVVDPGSVSVVSYTSLRPFVVRFNEHGDLGALAPRGRTRRRGRRTSDAAVGGGAG
jgi:probable phosphomutase (TIGR03848 family)